jgi:hypothetical protein
MSPNSVAQELVGTVTVKGPPVLAGKRVAVWTASGAPVSGLSLDGTPQGVPSPSR